MTNKKASYMNLKGTTLPSFRMGKNGIEFYSKALDEKDKAKFSQETSPKSLLIKQPTTAVSEEELEALAAAGTPYYEEYDMAIASKNIRRLFVTNVDKSDGTATLTLVLADGSIVRISQEISANEVIVLPESAKNGEIAVYGKDEDGNTIMTTSDRSFTDVINSEDLESEKENINIPSVKAVVNHISEISEPLGERLSGDNVSK